MKALKKVRLVNWHRFRNETITFSGSVLLSGENGAGKSTILDAIQFVSICSKAHFNMAAHEKGKRNLNSYIRCKTGREDRPFERTGELSAHIALEFFDGAKGSPFIVGAVMDSASEEKEANAAWYLMENQTLEDGIFFDGSRVKGISAFRSTNKNVTAFATTAAEARKLMLARFGRLEDKFFSLIPKALAFKPIHDIKDFVYSYVLDEKDVSIDTLKENVRSYQDLERMLQSVKERIGKLERICELEREVENGLRRNRFREYGIARADKELTGEQADRADENIRYETRRGEELERKKNEVSLERDGREQLIRDLAVELQSDSDYQAFRELERKEAALKEQIEADQREVSALKQAAAQALEDVEKLLAMPGADACMAEYAGFLKDLEVCDSLVSVSLCLENVTVYKEQTYRRVQEQLAEARVELRSRRTELSDLERQIRELEAKRLVFPDAVIRLQQSIREQFVKLGRDGETRILCELLEITDPEWQNAVEGYLNTQRFYLLAEPEDFDIALSVYDGLRRQRRVYGVGLINTGKLEQYDTAPAGSLAEVVTSKNVWARRYANMVLGRVQRCDGYQELKNHPVSITRQCMRYQNHVVSAIRPEIYDTPYIGAEAYKSQLAQCRLRHDELSRRAAELEKQTGDLESLAEPLSTVHDVDVKYRLKGLEELRGHESALETCRESMKQLEASQTIMEKRFHLETLDKEKRQLDRQVENLAGELGRCREKIRQQEEMAVRLTERLADQSARLAELAAGLGEDFSACEEEYEKQRGGRELSRYKESLERARKANWASKEKAEEKMILAMRDYKVTHDFGAAESMEGFPEYRAEYEKLKNSQLLEYEHKVYRARQAAEEEFREQFLSRLQENIKQAQNEFKELNRALKNIRFSRERYEFLYEPSRSLKKYYRMIMDDFNVMGGESLFSGAFNAAHREVIDELFEKLALDDETSAKALQEYTDYRTYMDYDIKISGEDGGYMLYSKVSREKSGGETQTPFYITVAASFIQLYHNSIGGDAIGLVMMDEAFNNKDDERIAGVLSFMNHSHLQTIIAAPPDKIQYIGPAVAKVLLVLQDGQESYVEEFARE